MSEINFRGHTIKFNERENFWKKVEGGEWESFSFSLLDKYFGDCKSEFGGKKKVFIDIGAWNGVFSIYATQLGAKVYAIEPDDYAWAEMIENRELNNSDFIASQVAIYHSKGWSTIKSTEMGNSESGFFTDGTKRQTTPTDTLEGYIEHHGINPEGICLIKADTEGSEKIIFPSSKNFLAKWKPKIYLSVHPLYIDNMEELRDIIYDIYTVTNVQSGTQIFKENFLEAMKNNYNHSILLK